MTHKILRHEHLLVRATVKNPIKDVEVAKQWMLDLVEKVGMVVLAGPIASYCDVPGNEGITAAVCLSTSHSALHIWDSVEVPYINFDIYSCSAIDLDVVWQHLLVMEPDYIEYKFLDRDQNFSLISEGSKMFGIPPGVGPDTSETAVS